MLESETTISLLLKHPKKRTSDSLISGCLLTVKWTEVSPHLWESGERLFQLSLDCTNHFQLNRG